jgi:protein SCO1/2
VLAVVVAGACGDDGGGRDGLATGGDTVLAGAVRTPPLDVAAVRLPDATDPALVHPLRAPTGELHLVYFGYTSCPDVCPTTMSDISVALADLPDRLADRVTVALVTLDPERDSGEVLTGYLGHFFDRSLALRTTDPAALAAATGAFGVQWEVEAHAPGEPYAVAHSAVTYVVDDTGTVVVEWPFGFDSRSMTADLTVLLEEEHP